MGDLPQTAVDLLPLSAEPMSQWKKDADIRVFAQALYANTFVPSFGSETCTNFEKEMREQARAFTKMLMEASHSTIYFDFYQDAQYGQVAKYAIALKCCIQSLLEDDGFYSLAHVLEAESDMECSLLLASNFYYKQATLMLRNILEEIFLPIHFCDNVSDFDDWKANNYYSPNLRGKDGLIKRLLKKNIIHEPLATQVSNMYGNLSAYVHGSQSTLIHQNLHLGEVHQVEFNRSIFSAWSKLFCECVDVCIHLLKINYDQWCTIRSLKFETLAKVGKTLCHTCHNEDAFDRWLLPSVYCYTPRMKDGHETDFLENIGDSVFYRYICQHCGNTITVNANETPLTIVTCLSTDGLPSGATITEVAHLVRSASDPYCEWHVVQPEGTDIITPLLIHMSA